MKATHTDHFLSAEDLSIRELGWDELIACWNFWLEQAQATNDLDQHEYSHGVFRHEPPVLSRNSPHRINAKGRIKRANVFP